MRRALHRFLPLVILVIAIAAGTACASGGTFVRVGPPGPPVAAYAPAGPYGYVWQPGYYAWTGVGYQWVPGVWARPPYPGAVWIAPRWQHADRGWHMERGRWHRR